MPSANPDAPIRRFRPTLRPTGDEIGGAVEYDEDGQPELVGATADPRAEIFERLDGPLLLDQLKDRQDFAEALARFIRWCIRNNASLPDIGARLVSISRPIIPELGTGAEVAERYGISTAQQSQSLKQFRRDFGEIATLKTRNSDEREAMRKAAQKTWRRRKRKSPALGEASVNKDANYTESELPAISVAGVNSGGAE